MRYVLFDGASSPAPILQVVEITAAHGIAPHAAATGLDWLPVGDDVGAETHRVVDDGGQWVVETYTPPPDLRAHLRALRDAARENMTITVGGALRTIDTDPRSVGNLTSAIVAMQSSMTTEPVEWKGGGEFFDLSFVELAAVAAAAMAHVQAGYTAERVVLAQIDAETISTVTEVEAAFAAALA